MFQKLIFIYNTFTALKNSIIAEYRNGLEKYLGSVIFSAPILVAIRPKAWVWVRLLGLWVRIPTAGNVVSVVCFTGWSFVQGVLPAVVCPGVMVNLDEEALAH